MTVTIKDVARLAGVSVATVSRVLNDSAPVLATTAKRVRSVAEQLHFSPNGAARSLSMQRSHAIGVVLPDLYGEFFSELLRGMDQAAQRGGYALLVSSSHHDARGVEAASRAMRGRVDGLLVMAPDVAPAALDNALPRGVPTVLLNGRSPTRSVSTISVDNHGGAASMTRHLIQNGHKRIGFIAGAAQNAEAQQRERGYRAALREAGIEHDPSLIARGNFTEEAGVDGARALLAAKKRPTAIFAANDAMAVGALAFLRDGSVAVPDEIAVAGFDDIPVAPFLHPPLTSVRVGIAALGARATERLLEAFAFSMTATPGPAGMPRREVLPTELVIRASSGGPFSGRKRS